MEEHTRESWISWRHHCRERDPFFRCNWLSPQHLLVHVRVLPPFDQVRQGPCQHIQRDFGNLKLSCEFMRVVRNRKVEVKELENVFFSLTHVEVVPPGKRKHQEPISDLGTLRKEVCYPHKAQPSAHWEPASLPLYLCLSPPTSLSLLALPLSLHFNPASPTPSLPPLFLLPGTKKEKGERWESGPAIPYWINQRCRPSPAATSSRTLGVAFLLGAARVLLSR